MWQSLPWTQLSPSRGLRCPHQGLRLPRDSIHILAHCANFKSFPLSKVTLSTSTPSHSSLFWGALPHFLALETGHNFKIITEHCTFEISNVLGYWILQDIWYTEIISMDSLIISLPGIYGVTIIINRRSSVVKTLHSEEDYGHE